MNIEEILEDMDETLDAGRTVPLMAHKVLVDGDRLRELINDIRLNIPAEIKRAKLIDFDCERILNEAKAKAEKIIQDAETRAQRMISQETVQKEARQRGVDMLMRAQRGSNEIKAAAEEYVNRLLNDAEAFFAANLQEVKQTKDKIENRKR